MSRLTTLFPLWAILLSGVAFFFSETFSSLASWIIPLLAGVMFTMGLTLKAADFKRILQDPRPILVGVLLQFILMPLLAVVLAKMFGLSNQLTAGLVLVGCCAGGTASNVISYLARADLALSISMTVCSTLVGVVATPLLTGFYLSTTINVDTIGMLVSIIQIVLIPVLAGITLSHFFPELIRPLTPALPALSILIILTIIAIVVALNSYSLLEVGALTLVVAVVLHNLGGICGGFYLSRLMGFDTRQSHTIAIEVGMQNSGLGVALALEFFSATAALPGALFSVWHNISGSLLASQWSRKRESLDYLLQDERLRPDE
ncbi:MAG: bile acid:sodium symporter family protein [Pseudomonadota bacterium]|nr:bile acid:sodium symporter family protein [Pseudomonadota bacterium]